MNQRIGHVENDVKLQQFQDQSMSLEVTSLRKELAEVNDTRNDQKKKVEEAKDRTDDLDDDLDDDLEQKKLSDFYRI